MLALSGAAIAVFAAIPATARAAYTTPTSVDFGSLPVGATSAPQTVILVADCSNILVVPPPVCLSSATDLVNVSPGTTGDFAFTNSCPAGLGPQIDGTPQNCTFGVTFTPTAGGTRTGTLNTGTTGIGGLTPGPTVSLTGTGLATPASAGGAGTKPRAKKCKKKKSRSAASAKKRKCKKRKR